MGGHATGIDHLLHLAALWELGRCTITRIDVSKCSVLVYCMMQSAHLHQ